MRIGIIGCGNISPQYLKHSKVYSTFEVAALADLDVARAKARADEYGVGRASSVDELLRDPEIELIVNLTIPAAHYDVALSCLQAGKHAYNEKPLAMTVTQGRALVAEAAKQGKRVGGAPDTFLGAGHQTARDAIDQGMIGRVVAGTAFMLCPGHESWHPAPEFYYKPGGGPLMDMGPYYITALLNMIGPVRRVTAMTGTQITDRTMGHETRKGEKVSVETPDHVAAILEFAQGAIVTMVMSFAVRASVHPPISVFGTEGSLAVPDPNGFDGEVSLAKERKGAWEVLPFTHAKGYGRMSGVADMIEGIRRGRPSRASGELTLATLEVMEACFVSANERRAVELSAKLERPLAMPRGVELGVFDR